MTLSVGGIAKRFGDLVANDSIDLELGPGSLHAVLGENGAGKSTLMKILAGTVMPDAGEVRIEGQPVELGSPRASLAAGVGMLHQDPLACLPFTAAENFRLGSTMTSRQAAEELTAIADRFGFNLNPQAITRSLSVGERQQLEIVRLLSGGVRILILDEPTSGITTGQRRDLFAALRSLAAEGLIVLFVSHKLEEVNELCRSVTVMRHGAIVGSSILPRPESELVAMMFERAAPTPGRTVMTNEMGVVASLAGVEAGSGRSTIRDIDLAINRGEVIGLAGLEGSGQATLLRAVAGNVRIRRGSVRVGDRNLTRKPPRTFQAAGVALVPGGRLEEGLLPGMTLVEHLELAGSGQRMIDWGAARKRATAMIDNFRIKGGVDSTADSLSGGNQQRLLLALLPDRLRLLLMEHPTRGLDLESAAYVWSKFLERRADGTALVFSSSDLDELALYADRILVFFDGRIIAERLANATTAEEIGSLMGGRVMA